MTNEAASSVVDWVPNGTDRQVIGNFWDEVRRQLPNENFDTEVPSAWAFGDSPQLADELLALVLAGTKTGTAGAFWNYENGAPIPQVGELSIILDGAGQPRAVIRTTKVEIVPFNEVSEEHAFSEGEGDRTLASWRADHEAFWRRGDNLGGREFQLSMPVVTERFELLFQSR